MAKTSLHKSLKQVLHGNEGASGAEPGLTRSDVIVASKDTCINRENPNRNVSKNPNIVVGYDFDGTYDRLIRHGYTQGTWTLPPLLDPAEPIDDAGARNRYLSRSLLEFNLRGSGVTTSPRVNQAILSLTFSSHRNLERVEGITLDFHSFYCYSGTTGAGNSGGATAGDVTYWGGNATWYEFDYTGACEFDTGVGEGLSGDDDPDDGATKQNQNGLIGNDIGVKPPGAAIAPASLPAGGFTGNIWSMQGLGATGGLGQVYFQSGAGKLTVKSGQFLDFSQGLQNSGHYDATIFAGANTFAPNFNLYPSVFLTNRDITANKQIEIDITQAVRKAISETQGMLRIMINLRTDYKYNRGLEGTNAKDRAWVGFHSKETAREAGLIVSNNIVVEQKKPLFSPHITINYDS